MIRIFLSCSNSNLHGSVEIFSLVVEPSGAIVSSNRYLIDYLGYPFSNRSPVPSSIGVLGLDIMIKDILCFCTFLQAF